MRRRTKGTAAAAVVVATTMLVGCTSGSDTGSSAAPTFGTKATGSLTAWGFNSADEVGTSRVTSAAGQLKGLQVTLDKTSFDPQKFTTRVASGNVPDVVQMGANLVATYAAQGLIQPLDSCFAAHDVQPSTAYYPSVKDDITYDGHVWGVPQFFQPPAIITNERVMKAAGVTDADIDTSDPDRLVAAVKKMTRTSGGDPTVLGFDPVATGQTALWVLAYGGSLTDGKGKPTLTDPANEKGLAVLKRVVDAQGGYAKVKSFSDTFDSFGAGNQFVKDQVGAQIDNQWYLAVLAPYASKVQISAVPFRDASGKPFTQANGQAFVIPTNAKNKDAACAWALSLTSEKAWEAAGDARAATVAKTPGSFSTGLFTGRPEADTTLRQQHPTTTDDKGFRTAIDTFYSIVKDGRSSGASPAGQEISTQLGNVVTSVLLGQKTAKAALADAQSAALRAYEQATAG